MSVMGLFQQLIGKVETKERVGEDSKTYQLEIQTFWDSKKGEDVRMMIAADDDGWRAFKPLTADFIMRPDAPWFETKLSSVNECNGDITSTAPAIGIPLVLKFKADHGLWCSFIHQGKAIIEASDLFVARRQSIMNRLALAFGLSLFFLFNLSTNAQDNKTVSADASAVRATVTNYIEAYYIGDAARMQQTLHPHYLKQKIHGDIPVREQTGPQLVRDVRDGGGTRVPQAQRTEQVTVLDVAGNIAAAKLVTPGWTDYMTLTKIDGEWKILSVVQRFDD